MHIKHRKYRAPLLPGGREAPVLSEAQVEVGLAVSVAVHQEAEALRVDGKAPLPLVRERIHSIMPSYTI